MAVKPKIVTLTNSSVEVLNAIRNSATTNYRDYVPVATDSAESIREIGAIIMDNPSLQNEFLNALVNRIGRVLVTSKLYENPWAMFKKGMLEMGETVEEIFVGIANVQDYDPVVAETKVFERKLPDVKSAFHVLNYQKLYKTTVSQEQLKQAFLSWEGVTDLISRIIEQLYTGANYDEFLTMKYMLAKHILNGNIKAEQIDSTPATNPKKVITTVKGIANKMTFMNANYNMAGVRTHTPLQDQYVLIDSKFEAVMNVEVLATAFNMSKAEFMGHVVLVDGFGDLDVSRLNELFATDPTYTEIGDSDLELLNAIPLVVVDKDFFMIFDSLLEMRDVENGQGLYWNYFLHAWKIFSISPFAQAVVYTPVEPGVTSVTLTPDAVTVPQSFVGTLALTPTVVTTGFASQDVNYTITTDLSSYTNLDVKLSKSGVVTFAHLGDVASYPASVTVKATSVFDSTAYDECVITLQAPSSGV